MNQMAMDSSLLGRGFRRQVPMKRPTSALAVINAFRIFSVVAKSLVPYRQRSA